MLRELRNQAQCIWMWIIGAWFRVEGASKPGSVYLWIIGAWFRVEGASKPGSAVCGLSEPGFVLRELRNQAPCAPRQWTPLTQACPGPAWMDARDSPTHAPLPGNPGGSPRSAMLEERPRSAAADYGILNDEDADCQGLGSRGVASVLGYIMMI